MREKVSYRLYALGILMEKIVIFGDLPRKLKKFFLLFFSNTQSQNDMAEGHSAVEVSFALISNPCCTLYPFVRRSSFSSRFSNRNLTIR